MQPNLLCRHHHSPLLQVDDGELAPVPEAAGPVSIVHLVGGSFVLAAEDCFRFKDPGAQTDEVLPQSQIPGLHVLVDLGVVV